MKKNVVQIIFEVVFRSHMVLKNTCLMLRKLLEEMNHNLDKAEQGNKTAAQRVRIGTIKFAKVAKVYRKESVDAEKKTRKKRR